jgi:hypothetical protein
VYYFKAISMSCGTMQNASQLNVKAAVNEECITTICLKHLGKARSCCDYDHDALSVGVTNKLHLALLLSPSITRRSLR